MINFLDFDHKSNVKNTKCQVKITKCRFKITCALVNLTKPV